MSNFGVHAAVFAAGAIVGGAAAFISSSQKRAQVTPVTTTTTVVSTTSSPNTAAAPVVSVSTNGAVKLAGELVTSPRGLPLALRYGHPGPIADPLVRQAYVAAYDRRLRHPAWTAEHLTLASLGRSPLQAPPDTSESGDRTKSSFIEDQTLPVAFRSKLSDYFQSGYDRGHMVPAADAKFSQSAMDETFLLSNIAPQVGEGFNRHYWAYLEDWCRRLTTTFADVYVFTVPLYLPRREADGKWRVTYEVIGNPPNVAVPTHFAKVVLTARPSSPSTPDILELSQGAFVLPNAPIPDGAPLESFVMPVEAVERAAGLTLLPDSVKNGAKHICQTTKCQVIVRRFDDARKGKRPENRRAVTAP